MLHALDTEIVNAEGFFRLFSSVVMRSLEGDFPITVAGCSKLSYDFIHSQFLSRRVRNSRESDSGAFSVILFQIICRLRVLSEFKDNSCSLIQWRESILDIC